MILYNMKSLHKVFPQSPFKSIKKYFFRSTLTLDDNQENFLKISSLITSKDH